MCARMTVRYASKGDVNEEHLSRECNRMMITHYNNYLKHQIEVCMAHCPEVCTDVGWSEHGRWCARATSGVMACEQKG